MLHVRIRKEFGARGDSDRGAARAEREPRPEHQQENQSEHQGGGFSLDVDFNAPPGVTILFGASGSGKSLTLKSIAGLVRPDEGLVAVGETVLFDSARRLSLPVHARGVGYVFQNLALFPHLTALGNVEFPLSKLPRSERKARARSLLKSFGIEHVAERLPRYISGGEAQRVALARALASGPRILLLDEPLSALDDANKLGIIADLKKLNRKLRLPVVYVTHNRDEALTLGERVFVYERGRIVASGEPSELFGGSPAKASVARLTGVENIFEGRILSRCVKAGTMTVEVGSEGEGVCRVEAPLVGRNESGRLTIAVRSGDILLAIEEPRGISARNILRGRVVGIEDRSDHALVRVASGVVWAASITKESARRLGLSVGKEVWLAFKTYSCRVLDGE
jgi:molybdate transport system ATP-binding protein